MRYYLFLLFVGLLLGTEAFSAGSAVGDAVHVLDDFEDDAAGEWPSPWTYVNKDGEYKPLSQIMGERKRFYVVEEGGNKFVRAYTDNDSQRISLTRERHFDWNLGRRPRLQWRWRANHLPAGASETKKNDAGAAVYVTFGKDWLGRPKSIKYTYSSTLPVGTEVVFGPLKALVVSSGKEGAGSWQTVTRDVAEDYRRLFGEEPPPRPASVTLWSDSDTTGDKAEVDFDDIKLLPTAQ